MARLPIVSSDSNAWGSVLNDFLSQAHNADGSIKNLFFNVKDPAYGAKGDGTTDDTAAIAAAFSAASAASASASATSGGVRVYFPFGVYLSGNQTLSSNITYDLGGSTIKLKAGANTDLFSAQTSLINMSAAFGSGIVGTLGNFSIRNGVLDGNKANQSGGPSYPLRFYGYNFVLRELEIKNGYSGGAQIDWSGTTPTLADSMESSTETIKVHDCNGIGFQFGGPHDSFFSNIMSWGHSSHGFHFAPNATGALCINLHPFYLAQSASAVGILVESQGCSFVNCMVEGSDFIQFAALGGDVSIMGGEIFGNTGYAGVGLQLGQVAGGTPIPGEVHQSGGVKTAVGVAGCNINTKFNNCVNGALNCVNESGNTIFANIYQTSGSAIVTAPSLFLDTYVLNVVGLTSDGTLGKSGGANFMTKGGTAALTISDTVLGAVFSVTSNGNISASSMAVAQSATAVAIAASATIATANIGSSRVAPTGNVAGIILAAGTVPGQTVQVVNESAFTVTFAASGTSHVADGVLAIIAANRKMDFTWDSAVSLWYHS